MNELLQCQQGRKYRPRPRNAGGARSGGPQFEQGQMTKSLKKSKSKMAAGRHLGFWFTGHNFWSTWARHFKSGTGLEIHETEHDGIIKIGRNQIQDGGRPPSWISVEMP